jgi:hypothetical protein
LYVVISQFLTEAANSIQLLSVSSFPDMRMRMFFAPIMGRLLHVVTAAKYRYTSALLVADPYTYGANVDN